MAGEEKSEGDLLTLIDEKIKRAHTKTLDLSFNEILDMSINDELDISPEYQRLFKWSPGKRSRFIESLLLELPIPPVYVVEESDGKYSLIDGLQRISSYLHFRGKLDAPHLDPPVRLGDYLELVDCDIIQELNGKTFNDLGTALQIRVKRAFIRVEVVRKESDPHFKYYMFKRLNTGGETLSEQQVRNCTIRLLSNRFNDYIQNLAAHPDFVDCIQYISGAQELSAFDQELVLRFFAFKNWREHFKHGVSDFLTEYMEYVSEDEDGSRFNYDDELQTFEKTFRVLNKTLSDQAFARVKKSGHGLSRSFAIYHYEAITLGIQSVLNSIDPDNGGQMEILDRTLREIKENDDFNKMVTGGGKNSPGLLSGRIDFVSTKLSDVL